MILIASAFVRVEKHEQDMQDMKNEPPNQALQATSVTRGVFGKVTVSYRTQRGA